MKLLRWRRLDRETGCSVPHKAPRSRGQSLAELALILPFLLLLLAVVVEVGLALNSWLRVNTAARDATRFALDAGRPADTASLVVAKLQGMEVSQLNVYLIEGKTNSAGNIPPATVYWSVTRIYTSTDTLAQSGLPRLQRSAIETRLASQGNTANIDMPFKIVEVDYVYRPLVLGVILGTSGIPMTSYAIVQQY